jgi:hypothetical protein
MLGEKISETLSPMLNSLLEDIKRYEKRDLAPI